MVNKATLICEEKEEWLVSKEIPEKKIKEYESTIKCSKKIRNSTNDKVTRKNNN